MSTDACPRCGAMGKAPCVGPTGRPIGRPHPARLAVMPLPEVIVRKPGAGR